jgi:ABC-type antimicrobial peptide transport system permease subunit
MGGTVSFIISPRGDINAVANTLREAIDAVDPTVSVAFVERLSTRVAQSYSAERYRTVIVAAFGMLATVLTVVGLYGVTLRAVVKRKREVGIRVALGATPLRTMLLMMSDTVVGVAAGIAIGLPMVIGAGRWISGYLFGIEPVDPVVIATVLTALVMVALFASALPARIAGRTNPAEVLGAD